MLYLVLALVLTAFGLLIAALTTANTLWAWISVVLSVVAAALLITDWLAGRRRARTENSTKPTVVTVGGNRTDDDRGVEPHSSPPRAPAAEPEFEPEDYQDEHQEDNAETDSETTGVIAPVDPYGEAPAQQGNRDLLDEDGEPVEEPTDAADLLIVAELGVEVRVVDEHPRYHLANCRWLSGRSTIPIAIAEARQLGFTPCAVCGPDAVLAQRHRAGR